jgi:hypothetical protein
VDGDGGGTMKKESKKEVETPCIKGNKAEFRANGVEFEL